MKKNIKKLIELKDSFGKFYLNEFNLAYFLNKISTYKLIEIKNSFIDNKNSINFLKWINILIKNLDIDYIELPYLIYIFYSINDYLYLLKKEINFKDFMNFVCKNYYFLENKIDSNCKYKLKAKNPYPISSDNKEYINLDNKNIKYLKIKIDFRFSNNFFYISRLNKILLLRIDENKIEIIDLINSEKKLFLKLELSKFINQIYYNDNFEILVLILNYRYILIKNGSDDFNCELNIDINKFIKNQIIYIIDINSKTEWFIEDNKYNIYLLSFKNNLIIEKLFSFVKEINYFCYMKNNMLLLKDTADNIFIIDILKKRILKKFNFNGKKIREILFNPLYLMIIFSSFDNNLNFFYINKFLEIDRIDFNINHYGIICNIILVNNNKNLLSVDELGFFKIWDLKTGSCIQNFKLNIDCKKLIHINNKLIVISQKIFYTYLIKSKKIKFNEKFIKVEYNEYLNEIFILTNKRIKIYDFKNKGNVKYELKNIFDNNSELKDFFFSTNYFNLIIINLNNELCFYNYYRNLKKIIIKLFEKDIIYSYHDFNLKIFLSISKNNVIKIYKDNLKNGNVIKKLININDNNEILKSSISSNFNLLSIYNKNLIYFYELNNLEVINIFSLKEDEKIQDILFFDKKFIFLIILKNKILLFFYNNSFWNVKPFGKIVFNNKIKKSLLFYDKIILVIKNQIKIIKINNYDEFSIQEPFNFNINIKIDKNYFNFYLKKPNFIKILLDDLKWMEYKLFNEFSIRNIKILNFKIIKFKINLFLVSYINNFFEIINFKGIVLYNFDFNIEQPIFINKKVKDIELNYKKKNLKRTFKILNSLFINKDINYINYKLNNKIKKFYNILENYILKENIVNKNNLNNITDENFLKNKKSIIENKFNENDMENIKNQLNKKNNYIDLLFNIDYINEKKIPKKLKTTRKKILFFLSKNKKKIPLKKKQNKYISQMINPKKIKKLPALKNSVNNLSTFNIKNYNIQNKKKNEKSKYVELIQNLNKKIIKVKFNKNKLKQ